MPRLQRLAHRDTHALLKALSTLYSDVNRQTLAGRTMETITSLIPANITAFDSWKSGSYGGFSWGDLNVDFTPGQMEVLNTFVAENPVFVESVLKRRADAIILTDFVSFSQFSKTNIYNEFYRDFGDADTQMAIALPVSSELNITCQVNRKGKDFSERDRTVLNLVAPHLINAIRNAFAFERFSSALETMESGVIAIDADGKTQFVSDFARQLLKHYFSDQRPADNSLPQELWSWVTHNLSLKNEFAGPIEPFKTNDGQGELTIRLLENRQTTEKTLLLEERKSLSPRLLEIRLALTKRESEVLFWISMGKSDAEIAMIFGISPYTVHKHAQNIYVKLGVETRTAAMLKAREVL